MRAALDETFSEHGAGIAYVVAATVVVADEVATTAALQRVLTQQRRTRPLHWRREGPVAKGRLVDCLIEVGAIGHVCVHYPTGRKKLEAARARGMREVIPRLVADGANDLTIESRGGDLDRRDQGVTLDVLRDIRAGGSLAYHWETKSDPFLWLADGLCGVVSGFSAVRPTPSTTSGCFIAA
ncbi:MAG: hypothetical protein ACRDXE_00990 [Acidimicrobiales bacterium]